MKRSIFDDLLAARAAGRPVALATNLRSGQQLLIFGGETKGDLCLDIDMVMAAGEAIKTDRNPLLLKTEMGAGHGGPSGRYNAWRDEAFVLAFILDTFGITD